MREHTRDPTLPVCSHHHQRDLVYEYGAMRTVAPSPHDWAWLPEAPAPGPAPPIPTIEQLEVELRDPVQHAPAPTPLGFSGSDALAALEILGWGVACLGAGALTVGLVWLYYWMWRAYILYFMVMAYAIPAALFLALCMRTFVPVRFLTDLVIGAINLATMPVGGLIAVFRRKRDDT